MAQSIERVSNASKNARPVANITLSYPADRTRLLMDCRTASSSSTIPIRGAMISSGFLSEEIEYCCRNISSVRQLCHSFSGDTAEQLGPSFENSSYPPTATQHERART